ncbi:MAG TPA: endonuclease domain-containing protein [Bauldia sp.]|nr:endonuclease domain-containing protein [Bauldia sp.]
MPHEPISTFRHAAARRLRREQTSCERMLWQALRGNRFEDMHFRRQTPMGAYIVDFVSHAAKLVVELDGEQHGLPHDQMNDRVRDAWLARRGYRVLRFWNSEVKQHIEGVLAAIRDAASTAPLSPTLPRKGGGSAARTLPAAQDDFP